MYGTYKIYKDGKLITEQKNKLTVLGRANALKAMLGQNQYFANSFGIGVSSLANSTNTTFLDMTDLDFTVGKFPISMGTLGTAQDSSTDGLVYTSRITDTSRYYITEIGLFSNVVNGAVDVDDLTIFNFEDGDPIKETPSTSSIAYTAIPIGNPTTITLNGHGFINNDTINFTTSGTLPTGIDATTTYYVVNSTTNTFQLAITKAGTAIATTTTGSGTHTINPTTVYVNESLFSSKRGVSLVSDNLNYRIGNDAIKITGNKTMFYDDIITNLSDTSPADKFTLAAYNPFNTTHTVDVKFTSSSETITYPFYLGAKKYNVVSLARGNSNFNWSGVSKIEIAPQTLISNAFTITAANQAVVTLSGHGFEAGNAIQISTTGALPSPLNTTTTYYVKYINANTFNLSLTPTGASISTLGGSQSGTHTILSHIIFDGLRVKYNKPEDAVDGLVSRAVLAAPIEKDSGSIIDIQYILSMGLDTV
jgi:hypothetical protein